MTIVREPAVAGTFYDSSPTGLRKSIKESFLGPFGPGKLPRAGSEDNDNKRRDILAIISPHAGYYYSGYAAAAAFLEVAEDGVPASAVIIGPNHHGIGASAAIMCEGAWRTPLGEAQIDTELASAILKGSEYLRPDSSAHRLEHSLEVQVPFLQFISSNSAKIVPIAISVLTPEDSRIIVADLSRAIASALADTDGIIIASTDFTHNEPKASAEEKDRLAIGAIKQLDAEKLLSTVEKYNITMCGAVPTAVTIAASNELGAVDATLLKYYTSGDIIGNTSQVVGYAAMKIAKSSLKEG